MSTQHATLGSSAAAIHSAVMAHAQPAPGLRWADIGCGTGGVIRQILAHDPSLLIASDLLPWLPDDLSDVQFVQGDAIEVLASLPIVNRLLMVETIEHLDAPWTALRLAARKIAPGGLLVVTTPNIRSLRHRLELPARGTLTSFRPGDDAHLTPVLFHVVARVLGEEGLTAVAFYARRDVIPLTRGRSWASSLAQRFPVLLDASLGIAARRA